MVWQNTTDSSCLNTANNQQLAILQGVITFVSCLSVLGTLFVVICYAAFKRLKEAHHRVIFNLTFTDLFSALTIILAFYTTPTFLNQLNGDLDLNNDILNVLCVTSGAMVQFFLLSSLLWTSCIAHLLYSILCGYKEPEKYEWLYHLISWGLPFLVTVLLMAMGSFGEAGEWCWIDDELMRYVCLYAPLLVVILFNSSLYVVVSVRLRLKQNKYSSKE